MKLFIAALFIILSPVVALANNPLVGVLGMWDSASGGGSSYASVFSDDFNRTDSGTVGGSWTSETDTVSDLTISSNQMVWAGAGGYTTPGYVAKSLGSSYYKWRVSFSIGLTSLSSDINNRLYRIFIGRNAAGDAVFLSLKANGGTTINSVVLSQRLEDWSYNETTASYSFAINTAYTIEITGNTATSGTSLNGDVTVKINGTTLTGFPVSGLDSYARHVSEVRIGMLAYDDSTTVRTIKFDDFDFSENDL